MSTASVFVLDDDVAVCRILNRMLALEEYDVRTSHSVAEAVTAIKEKSFDAYVLDYRLRDGTGLDVAEQLRSTGSSAPIILMSGYDLSGIASRAESLRVFDMIQKPFSRDELFIALKKSIGTAPPVSPNGVPVSPNGVSPSKINGAKAHFTEPVAPKKRSTSVVRIGAVIFILILVAAIIYLLTTGH
jgi:ActR/RegA family two-component response regulator